MNCSIMMMMALIADHIPSICLMLVSASSIKNSENKKQKKSFRNRQKKKKKSGEREKKQITN